MKPSGLSDRLLVYALFCAAVFLVTYFGLLPDLPRAWRLPGSRPLYAAGAWSALLLFVSAAFLLAKRTGRGGSPVRWFSAHVTAGVAGTILAAVHSAGRLRYAPALLLLALAGLVALGVWARVRLSRRISAAFGQKAAAFEAEAPWPGGRLGLSLLIAEKERLLVRLDPAARERTFSLTLSHALRRPRLSAAYARLVREENRLLGMRRAAGPARGYWRGVHIALAALFLAGVIGHVVVVTWFAGYVSGGEAVYWPHLAAW